MAVARIGRTRLLAKTRSLVILLSMAGCLAACGGGSSPNVRQVSTESQQAEVIEQNDYRIGPGDLLDVFVWRNPEISVRVPVRPDGRISTPLVEDMTAVGKTPSELARSMEEVLATYIKSPSVNIIVVEFRGTFAEQVRVVGQAANPQSIAYRQGMTILDLVISVGGLSEFAAGNRAKLVREVDGETVEIRVRLRDLLNKGDISQNIDIQPGDVLIIPESMF